MSSALTPSASKCPRISPRRRAHFSSRGSTEQSVSAFVLIRLLVFFFRFILPSRVLTEQEETSSSVFSVEFHEASIINEPFFFFLMPFWSKAVVSVHRSGALRQLASGFGRSEAQTASCFGPEPLANGDVHWQRDCHLHSLQI